MASFIQRKNKDGSISFQVVIRKKGFPTASETFKTEKEAKVWALSVQESMESTGYLPEFKLKEYIDRFEVEEVPLKNPKYANKEKVYLAFWKEAFGEKMASNLTAEEIERHADTLLEKTSRYGVPYTLETRRKYIQSLGHLYNLAIKKWRWCAFNPVASVNLHHDLITKQRQSGVVEKGFDGVEVYEWKMKFMDMVADQLKQKGIPNNPTLALVRLTGLSKTSLQQFYNLKRNVTLLNLLKFSNAVGISIRIEVKCPT